MRLTVGKKLNAILGFLLIVGIGGALFLATRLFTVDLAGFFRKETLDSSALLAGRIRSEMRLIAERAQILGAVSLEEFRRPQDRVRFLQENFATDSKFMSLCLYYLGSDGKSYVPRWRVIHPEVQKRMPITLRDLEALDVRSAFDYARVSKGDLDFRMAEFKAGVEVLRMAIPLVKGQHDVITQFVGVELDRQALSAIFAQAANTTSYLVERRGQVLGSTDPKRIPVGKDVSALPLLAGREPTQNHVAREMEFLDENGARQIGTVHEVGFGGLKVVSQVPYDRALEGEAKLRRRTLLLGAAFVFLALALGLWFSKTLTGPMERLADAAERVKNGDFQFQIETPNRREVMGFDPDDEIRQFARVFNQMVKGLSERQRMQSLIEKFHQKEIVDRLLAGNLSLSGERCNAAVLFADIRGFTEISEGKDPGMIMALLNRYTQYMANIVLKHGGIVDKYIGDGIMAVWGAPQSTERDVQNAVAAVLEMRSALAELNDNLSRDGFPALKIGMGLTYGPLIAGTIGSDRHMEYTVVGDTVNTASRVQELTKKYETDILITAEIAERVKDLVSVERIEDVAVRGKKQPIVLFRVVASVPQTRTQLAG